MGSAHRRAQLGLAAAAFVLVAATATLLIKPRYSRPVGVADVGTVAPDFQLRDREGAWVTLSELRGQVEVLCFGEGDTRVDHLARQYADDPRVKFLSLTADPAAAAPADKSSFATLNDDHGAVAARYSVKPAERTFVLLDPHGVVRYRGPFADGNELAFTTRRYVPEVLQDVLGAPTATLAGFVRN
jgi:cytochrome oxidase Cu insertion factor (SCO1/SenC/PrrC family)